jgi:imidazolonepropionase-like amidohydrolase
LAKKYKIKTAWGTDVLFSRALAQQQGAILASLVRWYTPAEALVMATSTNAELLALSGKRNPYPGKLGVVEEGALADLLLVDGNPLDDIKLIADPANSFNHHEGRCHLQERFDRVTDHRRCEFTAWLGQQYPPEPMHQGRRQLA